MIYIAIGPFAWGRGFSPDEAIRNCKKEIPWNYVKKGECKIVVWQCEDNDARVNEMGGIVSRTKDAAGNEIKLPVSHLVKTVKQRRL